jgi:hypothetical protein
LQSVPACVKTLEGVDKDDLKCESLSTECKALFSNVANAGCCAPVIGNALGGSIRDVVLKGISKCANVQPPQCAAGPVNFRAEFPITIPNLDLGKLTDLDLVKNVTNSIIADIAARLNVPSVAVSVKSITNNGQGVTVVVSVSFTSENASKNAQTNANAQVALPETANVVGQAALLDSTKGVYATFPSNVGGSRNNNGASALSGAVAFGAGAVAVAAAML